MPTILSDESALSVLAILLLIMGRAGLALNHTGLTRSKNAGNTISLHFLSLAISVVAVFLVGQFVINAGSVDKSTVAATTKAVLVRSPDSAILQCLAAALVLSFGVAIPIGALVERWRLKSFAAISLVLAAIIFPLAYRSCLPSSWLAKLLTPLLGHAPIDIGGSAFVHLLGGVVAIVGIKVVGPRLGKYDRGRPRAFFGHNVPMVVLGTFLLTVAWPGTLIAFATPGLGLAVVAANSVLAAAAGTLASALYIGNKYGKPDPSMITSGAIAGMVAISGGAAFFPPWTAVVIGGIAGLAASASIIFLEARGVDDPAGVVSIHGIGGFWGTLAVGIFAQGPDVQGLLSGSGRQIAAQLILALLCVLWGIITAWPLFKLVGKFAGPNRVPAFIESAGLDTHEMGLPAYPEFVSMSAERSSGN